MKLLFGLNNIHKSYGAQVILNNATLSVYEGHKIGVIGRNGAGKSTLCKIIAGHEAQDSGSVSKSAAFQFAYLEQHDAYSLDETVIDFLVRYTKKEHWQCGKVAASFQLKNELLGTTIGELPGGYRTRVKLAAMLLRKPNFLILDEPSNYLDLKTLILLEEFLKDYRGGFLIVSHDREFLKKTCKHTLEIENGQFNLYPGTVEQYLIFKEEQKAQAISYNKNIKIKQKQLQQFIDRFRAKNTKARQAKSKQKQIEKLETIEIGHALGNVKIKIPVVAKKKTFALKTHDLAIGYPDNLVAGDVNLDILQGAHVAVLGDNGQGKTTFLRTLAEDLEAKGGIYRWGHELKVGYYAQHVFGALNGRHTVYDHLSNVAADEVSQQEILDFAGSFLFKGDDINKRVEVLSGGEKARLSLAGLLLTKSQVLLLDEPTNHLDFETVEALGGALKNFDGTLFFISHDRTFVNLVTTEIVEINNGAIKRYPGTYEEYVYHMEKNVQDELSKAPDISSQPPDKKKKSSYHLKKELKNKRRTLKSQLRETEEKLTLYKNEYNDINQLFIDNPDAWSRARNDRYEHLKKRIDEIEHQWLEVHEKIDELENKDKTR